MRLDHDPGVRVLVLAAFMGCTISGRGPDPVTARPPHDPARMPSEVLEKQDPGADTSKNPVLSRSEANPHPWLSGLFGGCGGDQSSSWSGRETFIGCGSCSSRNTSGAGTSMLVALAALVTTRRRRRS
jgi:MYXO-CTERM domain-containing protein